MSHSEPEALRLFVRWVDSYLMAQPAVRLRLHLHLGNDEAGAIDYWLTEMGLPPSAMGGCYTKPDGTGHRKNHLPFGVCKARISRSADAFIRAMAYVECARDAFGFRIPAGVILSAGR